MIAQTTMIVAINKPIAAVFAYVANAETAPQWQEEIVEVRCTTAGLIGVGTTYYAVRSHLRELVGSLLQIVEYEPYQKVSFECTWGALCCRDSYALQTVGASTRLTYSFDLAARSRGARRVFVREAADLSNLKDILEAQGRAASLRDNTAWPARRAAGVQSPH